MLTIHGKGGHGRVVADACMETFRFTDDADGTRPKPLEMFIVAIGDNRIRRALRGTVNVVHRMATIAGDVSLGRGIYIGARAVVNPGAEIRHGAIINTGAIVEHDCDIGEYSHIAPGAVLCGGVTVGEEAFVGAGAVVREGIHIGDRAIIGCGAVVIKDSPADEVHVGCPARFLRKVTEGEGGGIGPGRGGVSPGIRPWPVPLPDCMNGELYGDGESSVPGTGDDTCGS